MLCLQTFSFWGVFFLILIVFVYAADSGLVLKAIHLPREHGHSQEVTLEQLQVFQVQKTTVQIHNVVLKHRTWDFACFSPFIINSSTVYFILVLYTMLYISIIGNHSAN